MDELDIRLREMAKRESLRLPEAYADQMSRLCAEVRQGTLKPRTPRRCPPGRRMLVLAAIVAVLLSASALASGQLHQILAWFQEQGSLTQPQETAIQENTTVIGGSVTDHGVTVTLKEVYGDGANFFAFITITAPEGISLGPETAFEDFWCKPVEAGGDFNSSIYPIKTAETEGHQETFIVETHLQTQGGAAAAKSGETMRCRLCLRDLSNWGEYEKHVTVEGDWSMEFDLTYDSASRTMAPDGLALKGNAFLSGVDMQTGTVESITLRPLGGELLYWTGPDAYTLELPWPTVILMDGSEIPLIPIRGGMLTAEQKGYQGRNYITYQAETPILLDEVADIRFGETNVVWTPEN